MKNEISLISYKAEKTKSRRSSAVLFVKKKLNNRKKYLNNKNFEMAINDTLNWIHARINKINI